MLRLDLWKQTLSKNCSLMAISSRTTRGRHKAGAEMEKRTPSCLFPCILLLCFLFLWAPPSKSSFCLRQFFPVAAIKSSSQFLQCLYSQLYLRSLRDTSTHQAHFSENIRSEKAMVLWAQIPVFTVRVSSVHRPVYKASKFESSQSTPPLQL